jgi:hypothetical protein
VNKLANSLMSLVVPVVMQTTDLPKSTTAIYGSQQTVCTELSIPHAQQRLEYVIDSLKYAQAIQQANPDDDINIHVLGLYIQPSSTIIQELQEYKTILNESHLTSTYVFKCISPDGNLMVGINDHTRLHVLGIHSRDLVSRILVGADSCVNDCFNSSNGMGVNSTQQDYRSK